MFELFKSKTTMVVECQKAQKQPPVYILVFATLVIMLLSQVAGIILMLIPMFVTQVIMLSSTSKEISFNLLSSGTDDMQLINLFSTLVSIIGFLVAAKYYYHRNLHSLGIKKEGFLKNYLMGLLIGFVMMASALAIAVIGNGLDFQGFMDISYGMLFLYFIGFLIQGFNEELMMRGFFMNACALKKSMPYAIIVNSIVFACLHLLNDGIGVMAMVNLILAGISFSLFAVYFDTIIVCSAVHSLWNFAQGNMFGILVSGMFMPTTMTKFLPVHGMDWLSGGTFGLEGGFAVTIVMVVSILILCILYKKKQKVLETN